MGYAYNKGSRKTVMIVGVIVVAGLLVVGLSFTGFTTHTYELESELNQTKSELAAARQQNVECENALDGTRDGLQSCRNQLSTKESSLAKCGADLENEQVVSASLNARVNSCEDDKQQLQKDLKDSRDDYGLLAINSARPICCSFGDVQSGAVRYWNLTENSLVCVDQGGGWTVNCTTGSTNYEFS